jgi:hypothetical protein
MEVILSREYRALRADRVIKTFTIGLPEDPATTRFRTTLQSMLRVACR